MTGECLPEPNLSQLRPWQHIKAVRNQNIQKHQAPIFVTPIYKPLSLYNGCWWLLLVYFCFRERAKVAISPTNGPLITYGQISHMIPEDVAFYTSSKHKFHFRSAKKTPLLKFSCPSVFWSVKNGWKLAKNRKKAIFWSARSMFARRLRVPKWIFFYVWYTTSRGQWVDVSNCNNIMVLFSDNIRIR